MQILEIYFSFWSFEIATLHAKADHFNLHYNIANLKRYMRECRRKR